jgi:hypothetical protein
MPIRLPKSAAAILSRLRVDDEQRLALKRSNSAMIRRLKEQRGEAESRRAYLEKAKADGKIYREVRDGNDVQHVPDSSPLDDVVAELANINTQIEKLTTVDSAPRMTAVRLEASLDEFSRYVACRVSPSLAEGESLKHALAQSRDAIDAAKAERKSIAGASRTYDEVRERALAAIGSLAARGVPKVLGAFRGGEIEMPQVQIPNPGNPSLAFVPDGAALVAWLFQSELERRVDQLLEFNREDDTALSASEQTARIQAIDDRLITLYREEAFLVEAIIADGGSAFHFADRPAECVLGIRLA